jgi:hypothetical protein
MAMGSDALLPNRYSVGEEKRQVVVWHEYYSATGSFKRARNKTGFQIWTMSTRHDQNRQGDSGPALFYG